MNYESGMLSSHAAIHPQLKAAHIGGTVYGMCKAALERFTTGLASEVYADGIGVNVISHRTLGQLWEVVRGAPALSPQTTAL